MRPLIALSRTRQLVATRQQLLGEGTTPRQLAAAVNGGDLLRVRKGYYARPNLDDRIIRAVRIGGVLTCVSALDLFGVWVPDDPFPHVALRQNASRLRSPSNRFVRLSPLNVDGCSLHWLPLIDAARLTGHSVGIVDALVHVVRCQPSQFGIAALDSALNKRLIATRDLDRIFAALPMIYHPIRAMLEPRCMSGIETIVRLLLIELGLPFEVQVRIPRAGIVDFVVAGCIVIETDGHLGHDDRISQLRDYDRDVQLAARGYIVLRFNYRQVMFQRGDIIAAIRGALASHRQYLP